MVIFSPNSTKINGKITIIPSVKIYLNAQDIPNIFFFCILYKYFYFHFIIKINQYIHLIINKLYKIYLNLFLIEI